MHWLLLILAGRASIAAVVAFNALRNHQVLDDGARQLSRITWAIVLGLWASYYLIQGV